MITLKQLRHLQAICQFGTLHGAASAVHLTHSALTRSLKNLEEILGIELFVRHKNGMDPTEFCSQIIAQSEQVLLTVKEIQREADMARNIEEGSLHILVGPGTKGLVTRHSVPEFFMKYPNIKIRISEAMPKEASELLLKREADFLISGAGSFIGNDEFNIELIKPIELVALASVNHPLMGKKINWDELIKYPLVAPSYIPKNHPFLKALARDTNKVINLQLSVICSDTLTLKNILLKTDAWMIGPQLELLVDMDDGQLNTLDIQPFESINNLSVIEIKNRSRSPAAQRFIDICKKQLSSEGGVQKD
ncbi:MAG: LysR family transcriptional regulator [Bermanella sp.]